MKYEHVTNDTRASTIRARLSNLETRHLQVSNDLKDAELAQKLGEGSDEQVEQARTKVATLEAEITSARAELAEIGPSA